ncbi:hypothetical protein BN3660_00489 [Eubacteriaceae bacterium CHKCI004]|nr:hypothetical protein BN3660_00489 [Eubacteriaceae bacterium CHKCI004]
MGFGGINDDYNDFDDVKAKERKKTMDRFKKIYQQGTVDVIEIWLDTETGVQYVFHRNGNAAGFTPLLDKDGKPVVTP